MTGLLSPRFEKYDAEYLTNYVSSPSRCLKVVKGLVFTGCAVLCVLLYTTVATHSDWNIVSSDIGHYTNSNLTILTIPTASVDAGTKHKEGVTKSLLPAQVPQYYTIHTNEHYDIDVALRTVLSLCPDEVYYNAFTQPIKTGGEEKLHETGVRVRMFKKYFDAWESLHVVTDSLSDTAFVRDDVLRYIRDSQHISAFTSGTRVEAMRQYETYRSFLSNMSSILFPWTAPYFSDHMTLHGHMYNAGRGIVISGSNSQASYIKTAISSFRAMGCTLPVEVMYLGDDDLGQDIRDDLETIEGVITRDIRKMVNDQGWALEGWAGKAFAAFLSSFREVILLDADVLFFENPESLFDESGYVDTGALFFSDRTVWPQDKKSFLRKILPRPISSKARDSRWWKGVSGENQEAGVVVVDKWRHFLSVFLTARLNGPDRDDSDAGKGSYSFWWGDKETWWIGFELAGDTDYHFHQGGTGNIGSVSNTEPIEKAEKEDNHKSESTEIATEAPQQNTDKDDFEESLRSLRGSEHGTSGESATPADESDTSKLESTMEHDDSIGFLAPAPDADDVMKAIKAAEAARASRLPTQPAHFISPKGDDLPNVVKDEPQPVDPSLELELEPERSLSRRHLTKRDSWFDTAMERKRTNLTGAAMLELKDQNIILCSPQLLHLTTSGRPMWFNGWIQDNKHEASSDISVFEFFMIEKKKNDEWAEWAVGADNMCCLKGDNLHALHEKELDALKLIVDIAKENGSLNEVLNKEKKSNKNIE
ncbi:glycosyltransferase family 71 protein [Aureobasidium subglaciale EXF-2481]|uniref:Glycosyltransferase family 71 protein n=1 Tax=Aureobasidium subglaciale (strain EXF-2481) TaxID=1043005 RepID=A0A074YA24_AURSE|nr:glycosyltransferase family 71 protein [Aureobasidium subglaciale EXF-2481]KAI5198370.1 hypothetical protein E4T38_07555 [Aureobasidium subglaciale]KAI5217147.1 hypothetical protein E4T40_07532 [Aureobasidium subglaciale]KAI5220472.1 hypothetical protein E4T41_07481 [Aureobasidium subglaciale]KAI5258293.1 hypothetical protein E4T46_07458 [Aureobasidium subglaciale]KEQ92844.1 glycosyltransferase family 71 protein [Aureobasidium subglaciale EXF-2481]